MENTFKGKSGIILNVKPRDETCEWVIDTWLIAEAIVGVKPVRST